MALSDFIGGQDFEAGNTIREGTGSVYDSAATSGTALNLTSQSGILNSVIVTQAAASKASGLSDGDGIFITFTLTLDGGTARTFIASPSIWLDTQTSTAKDGVVTIPINCRYATSCSLTWTLTVSTGIDTTYEGFIRPYYTAT